MASALAFHMMSSFLSLTFSAFSFAILSFARAFRSCSGFGVGGVEIRCRVGSCQSYR